MRDGWVPSTLNKLDDEHRSLVSRNEELGMPPAVEIPSPAELLELRRCAEGAMESVLQEETPWLLRQFSELLEHKLVAELKQETTLPYTTAGQQWHMMKDVPMDTCEAMMSQLRADILTVCLEANGKDSTMVDSTILVWLREVMSRDNSEFKLSRFPQLEATFIQQAYKLWNQCWSKFSTAISRVLDSLLGGTGVAVRVLHDYSKLTAHVSIDTDRVIGAIVQLFGGDRVRVLKDGLSRCISSSVCAITSETVEGCQSSRTEILYKMKRVDEARQGIEAIACIAVRLPSALICHALLLAVRYNS
jgi:hypothetical protein